MELYYFQFIALFLLIGLLLPGHLIPVLGMNRRLDVSSRCPLLPKGLIFFLLAIGIVAGTRDVSLGNDYRHYFYFYDYIFQTGRFPDSPWLESEPGWAYLNYAFAILGVRPEFFFGFLACFTWLIFCLGSANFRQLLPLIFFFVFAMGSFYWSLSGLRQAVAISIFFYAIKYIIERKPIPYLVLVGIGATFHNSLLTMAPAYFLNLAPYYKRTSVALVVGSLLLAGSFDLSSIAGLISKVLGVFEQFEKYRYYLDKDAFSAARIESGTYLGFWLKGVFWVWVALQADKIIKQRPEFPVYANLFIIYVVLSNLFLSVEMVGRFTIYFSVGVPVMAAATVYTASTYTEKVISHAFLLAFSLLFVASTYSYIEKSTS